jgi:hypothetical protein
VMSSIQEDLGLISVKGVILLEVGATYLAVFRKDTSHCHCFSCLRYMLEYLWHILTVQ